MKKVIALLLAAFCVSGVLAQTDAQKIYETEREFEKAVAAKGMNAAFIEFLTADGVMLMPGPVNGREAWKARPASSAALLWNPIWIDVASNGALAYSIGNSIYRPQGKDDPNGFYGHYLSVWSRQPNDEYRAVFDTGITHEKPANVETAWKSPADIGAEKNENKSSAADSSVEFYARAEKENLAKAYKIFLAEDAYVLREGRQPFVGKKAALDALGKEKSRVRFAKRAAFLSAADLAYIYNDYALFDKTGAETEKGTFVQVWKLRGGRWQIVADLFSPLPKK